MTARTYPKFSSWFWAFVAAVLLSWFTVFLGVFHLILRVPVSMLKLPYLLFSTLTVLLSPLFYLARKRQAESSGKDVRLYFVAAGPYVLVNLVIFIFFGIRAGVLVASNAAGYYVVAILTGVLGTGGGYYTHRLIRRRE